RAPALQAGCQRFESANLHWKFLIRNVRWLRFLLAYAHSNQLKPHSSSKNGVIFLVRQGVRGEEIMVLHPLHQFKAVLS
ncbi:hypothetical protein, partial [Nostoc sp. JL31]|uniref:hypothetical protein n=1 Tax=Nostoc sp. JL31 TaxID=2815395 RepID=UPI0025F2F38C